MPLAAKMAVLLSLELSRIAAAVTIKASMLRDYVDTPLSVEEIGDLLTMTGFEIEGIEVVDAEKVLDVNIMANRGDGPSVVGVARELLGPAPGPI